MWRQIRDWLGKSSRPKLSNDARAYQILEHLAPRTDGAAQAAEPAESRPRETVNTFICREAILDRAQKVAGYQFMLRPGVVSRIRASGANIRRLYDRVVLDHLLELKLTRLLGGRFALVEVDASALNETVVDQLPLQQLILVVTAESASRALEHSDRIAALRKKGLRLGLVHPDPLAAGLNELLAHLDVYILDLGGHAQPRFDVLNLILSANPELEILARGVDSYDTFEACHRWRQQMYFMHHFQGPFITRRESWSQAHIAPGKLAMLQMLNKLQQGAELNELAETLRQDGLLVFKLLRYVNSPAGGLGTPAQTIEQAILILGRERLARWLGILLFAAGESSPRDLALLDNALIRGRLLELLAGETVPKAQREHLFLSGLFSLLDRLLRTPMEELLQQIKLPDAVREALLFQTGPYGPWLKLAIACEDETGGDMERLCQQCGIAADRVNLLQMEAVVWAQEIQS